MTEQIQLPEPDNKNLFYWSMISSLDKLELFIEMIFNYL